MTAPHVQRSGGAKVARSADWTAAVLLIVGQGVVFSIVMAIRAVRRGRPGWPWPLVGTGIGVLGVLALLGTNFVTTS